jgi:hypothetical protein
MADCKQLELQALESANIPTPLTAANIKSWWNIFQPLFLTYCADQCGFEFTGGVLASWIPNANYLLRYQVEAHTIIPVNPGPYAPPMDAAIHKDAMARFTRYTEGVARTITVWNTYISPALIHQLNDATYGLAGVTPQQKYAHLLQAHGAIDPDFVSLLFNELDQPHHGSKLQDVLHRHRLYFSMRASMQAPIAEFDQIALLKKAFGTDPMLKETVTRYYRENPQPPRVPAQPGDQTYQGLVTVLDAEALLHYPIALPTHLTTLPNSHSANQAVTGGVTSGAPESPPTDLATALLTISALQATVSTLAAAQAQTQTQTTKPPTKTAPKKPYVKFTGPFKWCWGHGYHNHASGDCQSPLPGHIATSSEHSKQGGATYRWADLTSQQQLKAKTSGPATAKN